MAEQDLIRIGREFVEAINAADWQRLKATLAPDVVHDEWATRRHLEGADPFVQLAQGWKQAFPDLEGTITNAFASGNTVAMEVTWEGTHTAPLTGLGETIPATGKRSVVHSVYVFVCEGEKMKENRLYFDLMTVLQQIGVAPK